MERRFQATEVRVDGDDDAKRITGYAAVFYDGTPGTEFELWDGAVERIMPGAFDKALSRPDDVRALFNHSANRALGRTSSGTLKLKADKRGLLYETKPKKTRAYRDAVEDIESGDVTGSSFSFNMTDGEWSRENDLDIRLVRGIKLFDVGPATFPAYEGSTAGTRAKNGNDARASWDQWKERHRKHQTARRLRELRLAEATGGNQ